MVPSDQEPQMGADGSAPAPGQARRGPDVSARRPGCAADLDDSAAWPAVLGKILSKNGRRFWVQNAGVSGHSSTDHLYMLRTNPVVGDADLITLLVGANDLGAALAGPLKIKAGSAALEVRRCYKSTNGEIAQVTISTHPASRFRHSMTMRRVSG